MMKLNIEKAVFDYAVENDSWYFAQKLRVEHQEVAEEFILPVVIERAPFRDVTFSSEKEEREFYWLKVLGRLDYLHRQRSGASCD